eukprot:8323418-Pyramimonas_sp.AAC.1
MQLGNFVINPPSGMVEPGETLKVSVTFLAQNARTYVEMLGIHVEDRDPSDHPGGIPYEIAGESCIPGINTEDFASIFEEHQVRTRVVGYALLRGSVRRENIPMLTASDWSVVRIYPY